MRKNYTISRGLRIVSALLAALLVLVVFPGTSSPALAQSDSAGSSTARPNRTPSADRLFLGFAQDPTLAGQQWWEGQLNISSQGDLDTVAARLVFALQPFERVEFGGNIGFGDTDLPAPLNSLEGSGATDLDLWGKYALGTLDDGSRLAAGVKVTVPTGDDTAGLGEDAFKLGAFVSSRKAFDGFELAGHVGVNFNGDGKIIGVDMNGKVSAVLGAGMIFRQNDDFSFIVEANLETKQYKDAADIGDTDASVLGGVDWRLGGNGMLRGSLSLGLTDGAPDYLLNLGYVARF